MLKMIIKKLKSKIWLTLCLLLGITFLISTFSCFPMFEAGSIDLMIKNEFENDMEKTNKYPFKVSQTGNTNIDEISSVNDLVKKIDGYSSIWEKYFTDITPIAIQRKIKFAGVPMKTTVVGRAGTVDICYNPEITQHITILSGDNLSEESDEIGCIVSQAVVDQNKINVGEYLNFVNVKNEKKDYLKIKVLGVYDASDYKDLYWIDRPNQDENAIYITEKGFNQIMDEFDLYKIEFTQSELFDFYDINNKNMDMVVNCVETIAKQDGGFDYNFEEIVKHYKSGKSTIGISIWVLQIPVLGLVLAFIFMVSKQILEAEKNEMAMLYSRGIKRWQIILRYTVQSSIVAFLAILVGIPLGYGACKIAAGSKNFLSFSTDNFDIYKPCLAMIFYGLIAAVIALVVIIIPVFKYSKVTIVEHKAEYSFRKKMIWEKYFLDVVLLVVASYLLKNYYNGIEMVRKNALVGSKMDPMIFMDIILFLVASGLLMLRLSHYIVRIVYAIGKKKWKPATYASFLQIDRDFKKQCFISVFLTLTIAMGIFYANSSRTINGNYIERITYDNGADVSIMEKWDALLYRTPEMKVDYEYVEPDYPTYTKLCDEGICESITRVIVSDKLYVAKDRTSVENVQLMGIHTKEFGETANFKEEWNDEKHWYEYLNALAVKSNGIIISTNLAEQLGVKVGDRISCYRLGELADMRDKERGRISAKVCAIVDNWPGYSKYYYEEGVEQERYLAVMNYGTVVDTFKISPYRVWMKLAGNHTVEDVYSYISDKQIELKEDNSVEKSIQELQYNYLLQITNGLFTLSFMLALVLCTIGFLIYWISSIVKRQLLFGVYRAMGISQKEINSMLVNEHIFSTLLSVLSGTGVGVVASALFIKLFTIIFLPQKHNIPIKFVYNMGDYTKLAVIILGMIIICMICLRRIVKKMDISKSLKLGED